MSIELKKLRILWKEQLEVGNGENIDFQCSLDEGKHWISFNDILTDIRTPSLAGRKIPYATYEMLNDDYSSLDFTIPLTFNSIPGFSDDNCSIVSYPEDSEFGLPPDDYYIKIASISSDFVGLNESSTYVSSLSNTSRAKKFSIPLRGDIKLAVQYENWVKGLALYIGKKTRLIFETIINEDNTNTAIFNEYVAENYTTNLMPLEYGSILGLDYISSIDYSTSKIERISNSTMSLNKSDVNTVNITEKNKLILELNTDVILNTGDRVTLYVDVIHYRLSFISNLTTKLIKPIESNSSDPILIDNRYPVPFSGKIRINSEYIKYTNVIFESSADYPNGYFKLTGITRESIISRHEIGSPVFLSMLDGGIFGELPRKSIAIYKNSTNLKQYYHFDSNAYTDYVPDMTGNYNAKIIGTVDFNTTESFLKSSAAFNKAGVLVTKYDFKPNGTIHFYFKINTLPDADMCIFGNKNGLWMKISKDNLRLSVGLGNNIIIRNDNPKLSKIKIGEWTEISLVWAFSTIFSINRLYLYKDSVLEMDTDFSIFTGNSYFGLGGLLTIDAVNNDLSNIEYSDLFKGEIDDWRIYDDALSLDQILDLNENLKNLGFEYCGIININADFVKRSLNPAIKDQILDYSLYDGNLLKYDPYVVSYFSVLASETDIIDAKGQYSTTCDLWPLYSLENGNMFTQDLMENIAPDNILGNIINKYDGKKVSRLCYPINTNNIKYRFTLNGKNDGISSPIIKDFVSIVSSSTIDFYDEI